MQNNATNWETMEDSNIHDLKKINNTHLWITCCTLSKKTKAVELLAC